MNDLVKFQALQIQALKERNEYLENELKQAKDILQSIVNDWEVSEAKNAFDEMFENPLEQLKS
jgi:cell division septum initiation protein DivIVA